MLVVPKHWFPLPVSVAVVGEDPTVINIEVPRLWAGQPKLSVTEVRA